MTTSKIEINGEIYIKESSLPKNAKATKKQIVVLDRGWVVVGDVGKKASMIHISNASVIRTWGTKNGLGELAESGPLQNTKLDKCPDCQVHELSVVMFMNCNESKWS